MLEIECGELSEDEQIALAGEITESMKGKAVAVLKGREIVLDTIRKGPLDEGVVVDTVSRFVSMRRDSALYSVQRVGERLVIHSPDPIRARGRVSAKGLPPNLFKCPFCHFVSPYEELYVVHYRSHGMP